MIKKSKIRDETLAALGHSGHCFLNEKGLPIRLKRNFPEFYDALMRQLEGDLEESVKEAGAVSGTRKGKD